MAKPRHALITGASSDIGLCICRLYLDQGYRVAAHCNTGRAELRDLAAAEPGLTLLQIDFSDSGNLEAAIEQQTDVFTSADVLINGAAKFISAPFSEISASAILESMKVNLVPAFILMRTIAPAMVERGWGRIVNLSSIGTRFGGGSSSFAYALSKHGLEFIPSDHTAWAGKDVFVNTLRIGVTDTRFHKSDPNKDMSKRVSLIPAGRMATPEEIARAVYWFGSGENTFTTGQTVSVAGGE